MNNNPKHFIFNLPEETIKRIVNNQNKDISFFDIASLDVECGCCGLKSSKSLTLLSTKKINLCKCGYVNRLDTPEIVNGLEGLRNYLEEVNFFWLIKRVLH